MSTIAFATDLPLPGPRRAVRRRVRHSGQGVPA